MTANALQKNVKKQLFRIGQMAKENFAGSVSACNALDIILVQRKANIYLCKAGIAASCTLYHSTSKLKLLYSETTKLSSMGTHFSFNVNNDNTCDIIFTKYILYCDNFQAMYVILASA